VSETTASEAPVDEVRERALDGEAVVELFAEFGPVSVRRMFGGAGVFVDGLMIGLVSDGDMMEGITHEAAALAAHLKLGKLIWMYDDNRISLDGPTSLSFSEDVAQRFAGYGFRCLLAVPAGR